MNKDEFIPFSEIHDRAMLDPEFRRLYELPDEEDLAMRAFMDARIEAKKMKENQLRASGSPQFAT